MLLKVQMVNCQSWKDSSFTLRSDKLNVIIADNGTGKSVFFKMLKITSHPKYFDRDERKQLIRHGTDFAAIYFEFEDGGLAGTRVYPTYTLYLYKPSNDAELETSYTPSKEMLKRVGLVTDGETPFVANIVDSDQDLLLVNSRLKYNFNLVQLLAQNVDLENVKERAHDAAMKVMNPLSSLNAKCEMLNKAIQSSVYYDVATKELQLELAENSTSILYNLIDVTNDLQKIKELSKTDVDYDFLLEAESLLESLESLSLDDLLVTNEPPDVEQELAMLESLETFNLGDILVTESVPDVENDMVLLESVEDLHLEECYAGTVPADVDHEISLLESLRELNFSDMIIDVKNPEISDETIDLLDSVMNSLSLIILMQSKILTTKEIENEIHNLESELFSSGEVFDCAIHGKVIYNGKECIPCGE